MGYTHYWYRSKTIVRGKFSTIVADFRKLLPSLEEAGVKLAGPSGTSEPQLDDDVVMFNGRADCGHVGGLGSELRLLGFEAAAALMTRGRWDERGYYGRRECDGDCSHETFEFERVFQGRRAYPKEDGRWFAFCKTARKPYDLAVMCFLIIAKQHLRDMLTVNSDGFDAEWEDARWMCQSKLDYGIDFRLDRSE